MTRHDSARGAAAREPGDSMTTRSRTSCRTWAALLALSLLALGETAPAKDLSQRLGLGFDMMANSQSPVSGNQGLGAGLSGRYWIDSTWAIQGIVGFNVSSISSFELGDVEVTRDVDTFAVSFEGRLLGNVVDEPNMHLYAGGLFGVSYADVEAGSVGADQVVGSFGALGGAEFFLQGLPNLSLSTEIGFAVNVGSDPDFVSAGTTGNLFGGVAVHYYFGATGTARREPAAFEAAPAPTDVPAAPAPRARPAPAPAPLPKPAPSPEGWDIH